MRIRAMAAYALTIFTGAFLLFQVQPLIAKYILPWFGGGPGVWTACMLFFQVLLLGGYAYAHFLSSRLKPRTQATGPSGAAGRRPGPPAHHARRFLETPRRRQPDAPDSRPAHGLPRPALFCAVVHQPAAAALVQPHQPGPLALSAFRPFQRGLAPRAGELPLVLRDAVHPPNPGRAVGLGAGRVRGGVRLLRREIVEIRRPKAEVRSPKSGVRGGVSGSGQWSDVGSRSNDVRNPKHQVRGSMFRLPHPQPSTLNHQLSTSHCGFCCPPAPRFCCWRRPTRCARTWR